MRASRLFKIISEFGISVMFSFEETETLDRFPDFIIAAALISSSIE